MLSEKQFSIMDNTNLSKDFDSDDKILTPPQSVNNSFQPCEDNLHVSAETNSDTNVSTCVNNLSESMSFRVGTCYVESESCNSLYRCSSSNTLVFNSNYDSVMEPITSTAQELLLMDNSESLSLNVVGHSRYSPSHAIPTISCSGISVDETIFQENVFCRRSENTARGYGDGSSSSSDDDNNGEDKRGIYTSFASRHHSSNPQHSLPNSPRYKSLSAAVNTSLTPQAFADTSHVGLKHEGKMREVAAKPNSTVMSFMLPKSPAMYTSKGDYLIGDSYSLAEKEPILLDVSNGRNELVMAAYSTQSIPKLYPIVGLRKELPGIALPPPIPLDLPKINFSRKVTSIISHNQIVREQPMKTGSGLGTVQGTVHDSNVLKQQPMASTYQQQQQATLRQSVDFSDPVDIISSAAVFLTAGDYGTMIRLLEILDKHLVLPEDIDLAKEFGQGLAHYKNLHYRSAKPCFNALFEKSINYGSSGNQALASIYLGEIEMSWGKYKDAEKHFTLAEKHFTLAEKHFTLAVTYYSSDNVAEKFQQTILTKSTVLRRKGQCHWRLLQMREALNAFKMAKDEAEQIQQQTRRSTLKTAKEDELSALFELGNILQSIGDHKQSFKYYKKSLKLAGELGDCVSEGRAHGNLGNAMLGLDQKDKALDHLIMAFQMSARYEGNPLAVGRAVSNLGNAYQAIGDLRKAKEYYEIALGHAIYGNDLQGQGRACGNIGNVYMLLKEPVKAVHYYTETLRLSTDKNTKITGYHDRGCARFDVAECILQGKKPKELVIATTPNSVYGRLAIKLTDKVITTDPIQETREPSTQSVSEQRESSKSIEMLPKAIKRKTYDGVTNVEIDHLVEALPFLEAAISDLLQAIQSHEQTIQNVKGSHEALGLSLSSFESNSRSFYKIQEALVELGKLLQQLSELRVMDTVATEPQEFKDALVYGEQARARTLGELNLQKKRAMYSDLFFISTPLKIQDIYRTVELHKVPVVFLSNCVSKLLMWILVSVKDEVIMKCQSIDINEEELENSSFELYIRYNLLQFLSKDEIYIFRRCSYEQESPFTILHDIIGVKIIEGLKSVGCSEVTEFIVIPDSVTHLLPFCPLMNKDNWQFFGDKYRIRIVPSFLSLLVMSMTGNPVVEVPGDKSDFLIVGNPTIPPFMYDSIQWNLSRLPYAEKEAISVANIIGTVPVLREQATKQSVLYRLRSAKVIHLATHGSASAMFLAFTSSFPVSKSGLAEKEHILIFPKEIEALNISPALVVLSSCDSARGQVKAEGIIGMARAFLLAGAHSVLVSLWRVPDESANIFMQFFYQFLVNGLPSLEALQRSMQCLRCFLKYSHHVHWSGFQIIGKEVTFHKDVHTHFPIQKMLGEVSIFPRQQHVKSIKENLLGVKNKIFTDVQLLVGTLGNEPEECARDFIKNCYYYYPCGVYWYNASDELLLETNMKVAHETPLVGGVYKKQKELDVYPAITNPSLLTTKNSKPASRKDKKLIVLNNFTNLEKYSYIMREMKDASTDIIVVSNELFCKDEIAKDFDKYFSRGCNIIEVTSLEPISITQRIVYGLLEKNSFVARDADHIVFTLLSEYSRGVATIVHLLTSLMQKNEGNSRTGFELVKRQLKFHIAHQKLERFLNSCDIEDTLSSDVNENIATEGEPHVTHESDNCSCSMPQGFDHPGESFVQEVMSHNKKHADVSGSEIHETSFNEPPKVSDNNESVESSSCASVYIQNESFNIVPPNSHDDHDDHSIMKEAYKSLSTSEHGSKQIKVSKTAHGDDDIGITLEPLKLSSSTNEHGSMQTKENVLEIAHGDDVIGITVESFKMTSSTSKHGSTQTKVKGSEIAHGDDVIGIMPEPLKLPSLTSEYSSTQTKVDDSEIAHGDDVIGITAEGFKISSSTSSMQTKVKGSEIDNDDDAISITLKALRPSSTSEHGCMQIKAKGSEIDHGDDAISITLEALGPSSTSEHGSTQTKAKGSEIDHGDDVIDITLEAFKLPSPTGEPHTEVNNSEIAHGDDVIGIAPEALKIPSSTSKNGSTQTKVKGSKNDNQTATSDATQPIATAKLGKSNLTAVRKHPLCMYINDILSTASNISLPAHHLLNCLTITGPIPLPLFYVEALDNVVMNAIFSKEKKGIQAESPMKQLIKEGVIRNSCYPILYHKDLDPESIDSSIKPMFIPALICNAVKDEMDDADKALSILSAQSALKNLLTSEHKPGVTHLHYLLIVCNQLHNVCSQELHEFDQLLTNNLKLKLLISLTLSSKHDYRANLTS